MRQVIKHRDIRLLNMIRRTDPVIPTTEKDQWDFIGTYERIKWTHNTADPEWTQKREDEIGSIYGFAAEEKSGATVGQFVQVTDNV